MTLTAQEQWAVGIVEDCLREAGDDVDAGYAAAEYIIATQPMPNDVSLAVDFDESKVKRDKDGQFAKQASKIPHGELHHVGGIPVRRHDEKTYRIETDTGHVTGDAEKIGEHVAGDHAKRGLHGKARDKAIERATAKGVNPKHVAIDKMAEEWKKDVPLGDHSFIDELAKKTKERGLGPLSFSDEAAGSGIYSPKGDIAKKIEAVFTDYESGKFGDLDDEEDSRAADAAGFAALPKGAKVVSLDPNTHGRVGEIVKVDGVNRVKLEGTPGFASDHVEPLDEGLSWRVDPFERNPTSVADLFKTLEHGRKSQQGELPEREKVAVEKISAGLKNKREHEESPEEKARVSKIESDRKKAVEQQATERAANEPVWVKVKGIDVLKSPNSNLVAVPVNGKKNSARWSIIDPEKGEEITQLSKGEVLGWLATRSMESASEEDNAEFFRQRHGSQPKLFSLDDTGKGRWITIGGQKGEDGKHHGGSPVYIENGRITKGAPGLRGKKIESLDHESPEQTEMKDRAKFHNERGNEHHKEVMQHKSGKTTDHPDYEHHRAEMFRHYKERDRLRDTAGDPEKRHKLADDPEFTPTHRQQMHHEREYRKSVWAKKARKEGIDKESLHQIAGEMKANHDAHVDDVRSMLQRARELGKSFGTPLHPKQLSETGDATHIPGFDQVARNLRNEYGHLLGMGHESTIEQTTNEGEVSAAEKLLDYLRQGVPERMSEEEAYEQAFDYLLEEKAKYADSEPSSRKKTKNEESIPFSIDAFFAHDIANRRAQGVLNKAMQSAKGLTRDAKKDLATALKRGAKDSGAAIMDFIAKYRLQLAKLLNATQLASLLEGAREVAADVPTLAIFPGAVAPPPTLEPKDAVALVERLEKLTDVARAEAIYALPADQQVYAQQALAAKEAGGLPPPTFAPPAPPSGSPEGVHFPTIDEAVKQLAEKNVMTRERFDALDTAARAKSFAVASVDADDTLTKIRDVLAENVRTGADYETFKEKVLEAVDEGTFMSEAHLETVFRTNVQSAFSDGQMSVLSNPMVRSGFPYSAYDSIHDDRVRHEHLELDKLGIGGTNVYRNDDPVFQTFRPPWDYNCRCSWTPMTIRQASEVGVKEAQTWLDTGVEPSPPAFVSMPDFAPPPGFQRAVSSMPLSIQLSLQSLAVFSRDSSGHEHKGEGEGGGQFTGTGQGGAKKESTVGKGVNAVKKANQWLHDMGHAGFAKLPTPVQTAISTVVSVAFAGWTASQNIAERISVEKGSTPEQAAQTRSILAAADLVAFKPMAIATAPLGGAVAAASWVVPPVTACYLAHSAVLHPLATYRAARGVIGDIVKGVKGQAAEHTQVLST